MEKYFIDQSDTAYFQGITIEFPFLEEGLFYAKKHNVKNVLVRSPGNMVDTKECVDLTILEECNFIEKLHWLLPLSAKSKIDGIYKLSNLKNFRWGIASKFTINVSKFPLLEELSIRYDNACGWDKLCNLRVLFLTKVDCCNLMFLSKMYSLENLRIIKGTFSDISGIEYSPFLKTLFLQRCNSLQTLEPTIFQLTNMEQLIIENCPKLNIKANIANYKIKYISII